MLAKAAFIYFLNTEKKIIILKYYYNLTLIFSIIFFFFKSEPITPVSHLVSHDLSEIIIICWFAAQETFLIRK